MIVEITQEDIDQGIKGECSKCPLALALKRVFPIDEVGVYYFTFSVGRKHHNLSDEAMMFVRNFDESKKLVQPQTLKVTDVS